MIDNVIKGAQPNFIFLVMAATLLGGPGGHESRHFLENMEFPPLGLILKDLSVLLHKVNEFQFLGDLPSPTIFPILNFTSLCL